MPKASKKKSSAATKAAAPKSAPAPKAAAPADVRPLATVRRFDVFAEYGRLEGMKKGLSAKEAKGYGLWLAKVVAARKFGLLPKREPLSSLEALRPSGRAGAWHELNGIAQTDALFDQEIVDRMGKDFYRKVFGPAVKDAWKGGTPYDDIRDSIRKGWTPAE